MALVPLSRTPLSPLRGQLVRNCGHLRLTFFWFDYRRTLAYKQPTGLFALRLSLMRGANIIGSRELAGHGIATISGNGVEHFLSGIHLTGGYGRRH